MIEYREALDIILSRTPEPTEVERVPLSEAKGRVLAEDVSSDVDLPPFNKSAMDGFAIHFGDVATVPATLDVVMDIPAGEVPSMKLEPGKAASIMTGAPVPEGADAVVQVEWTSGFGKDTVTVNRNVPLGLNISPKAEIMKTGATVLEAGTVLDVEEIGLLAAVGGDPVPVFVRPRVAVLSTGDELVPAGKKPGPGQIRNTNGPALIGFLKDLGLNPTALGQAGDDLETLREMIGKGLDHDCLMLSGGVSAGAYDFVQDVLKEHKVELHTTRVAVKPGKPTVFGTVGRKMVFGMPGNPVSAMAIARVLAEPSLRKAMGCSNPGPKQVRARLTKDIKKKSDRLWFIHGQLKLAEDVTVTPVKNHGSADLPAAARGNCLIEAPKGKTLIEEGSFVNVVVWNRCI